jgi:putative phosphoesterase
MKIAIVSDIHGNIFALQEVIEDLKKRKCEVVLCLGDYLGYYYWPNQVIDILRALESPFLIRGNHEEYRKQLIARYGHGIEIALSEISDDNKQFLLGLDAEKVVELDGIKIGMYHGSQLGIDDYVYPDVNVDKLGEVMKPDVDVILLGHTHHQFVSYFKNKLLINPGSVGQARDVRGLAAYAIFNTKNRSVTPVRLNYNKSSVVNKIKKIESNSNSMLKALSGNA